MLLPGSTYAPDETTLSQHFRLGFGRRDFPQALERLALGTLDIGLVALPQPPLPMLPPP